VRAPILTEKRARNLRRNLTLPEVILWNCLRGGRLNGLKFRRQHPIGPYILDFFCAGRRLAVEVDGDAHSEPAQVAHDRERDLWLGRNGVTVLRFAARDVLKDDSLTGVLEAIADAAAPSTASGPPPP
jgi:very-short-patch-repair endonuclease